MPSQHRLQLCGGELPAIVEILLLVSRQQGVLDRHQRLALAVGTASATIKARTIPVPTGIFVGFFMFFPLPHSAQIALNQ